MIIMKAEATREEVENVVREIKKYGLKADVSVGEFRTIIGLIGDETGVPFSRLALLPGVKEARMVETPYKLISKEYGQRFDEESGESRLVKVVDCQIGGDDLIFIAGPCAVENKTQVFRIAEGIKKAGAQILRGGVFKPRSSVHSFQGLGANGTEGAEEALSWLRAAGDKFGLAVVTEVRGETQIDLVDKYVDMFQIGTRNMYDQDLLVGIARKKKPILFKRHFGAGIDEFLGFAEYIAAEGNKDIVLCERGILPLGKGKNYTRYTFDLGSIPAIQKETYLPIVADPSHAIGRRDLIFNMSCAAIAAGASGLMLESHYNPAEALVDGQQMITPEELKEVIEACQQIRRVLASRKNKQ
ncbi:3-deoxy-7-phosphoheptulonate synthase [Chloroflexota bacterium]